MQQGIQDFLTTIHSALKDKESCQLNITRSKETLEIAFIPKLDDDESKVPEEAKQIRAALALPLVMRGMDLETLANEFAGRMTGYTEVRDQTVSAYSELLASLKDATANAKNSKKAPEPSKDKKVDPPEKTNKKPKQADSSEKSGTDILSY